MVQVVRFLERNRAAQHIGLEAHIRVCEQQPLARRSFVGFLESMRLAQPAFGQPVHVHNAEPLVRRGKCVENLSRCVLRAVVNCHHFKARIIHFHECCKRSGQLFLFVSGAEKNGDSRAVRIRGGREISHPGKAYRSVGNPETVGEPKQRDPSKQRDSQKMHEDWSRRCPQVILARYGKDPGHRGGRAGACTGERVRGGRRQHAPIADLQRSRCAGSRRVRRGGRRRCRAPRGKSPERWADRRCTLP